MQHEKGRPTEVVIVGYGTEPRVAILDGNVLKSCPNRPFLEAALDAMTHACESLWVRNSSLITDAFAEKALKTFLGVLPGAIKDRDPKALQALMEASSAANLACGNTGLGLVHALSSAPSVKLPHGYQNGNLLLAVANFNRPHLKPEHQQLIDQLQPAFKSLAWTGAFPQGEIGEKEAKLMVEASTGHPFRANNIRSSTGESAHLAFRCFRLTDFVDAELFEILRQSGATVAAAA